MIVIDFTMMKYFYRINVYDSLRIVFCMQWFKANTLTLQLPTKL